MAGIIAIATGLSKKRDENSSPSKTGKAHYESINTNGLRGVDLEDLRVAIRTNEIPVYDSVINQFFELMDTGSSEGVSFEEFEIFIGKWKNN